MDGIRVIRVWSYITRQRRLRAARARLRELHAHGHRCASLFVRRVDVVVGTSPQFFTAVAAWVVGAVKRVPFVFELRDLWPESIKAVGAMKESARIRWLERLELFLYRRAARIVSVTHSFRDTLVRRGIDGGKIDVVTNGVDIARFSPRPKDAALDARAGLRGLLRRRLHRHARHGACAGDAAGRGTQRCSERPDGQAHPAAAAGRRRAQGRAARRRRTHCGLRQRAVRRFGAQGAGGALLVAARRVDHPPATHRAVHDRHPVASCSSAWAWAFRCCTAWPASRPTIVQREGAAASCSSPRMRHSWSRACCGCAMTSRCVAGWPMQHWPAAGHYDRRALALQMLGILRRLPAAR